MENRVAVRVGRGVVGRIRENPGGILIQVKSASDPALAAAALERAGVEIGDLDGGWQSAYGLREGDRNNPKWVSSVTRAPNGPFMFVDGGFTPHRLLRTIPDIVARHLEQAGVTEAVIVFPQGGALSELAELPRAVILCLHSGGGCPGSWLEEAAAWVTEACDAAGELYAGLGVVEFSLLVSDARAFLGECEAAGQSAQLAAGDLKTRARAMNSSLATSMVLAGGGPGASDDELLAEFDSLRALAGRLSGEVAQAYIEFEPSFSAVIRGHVPRWTYEGGAVAPSDPQFAAECLFDAFAFQILGPRHVERLGGAPDGARALDRGRVELLLGEPAAWMARERDTARKLLAPCLLSDDEAVGLHEQRFAGREPDADAEAPPIPPVPSPSVAESLADVLQRRERLHAAVQKTVAGRGEQPDDAELARRLTAASAIEVATGPRRPEVIARQIGTATTLHANPDPFTYSHAVTLALYLPPVRLGAWPRIPKHWFEEACAWVGGDTTDDTKATALVYSDTAFPLRLADGPELLRACAGLQIGPELWCGDWRRHARAAAIERHDASMILRAGGGVTTDDELFSAAAALKDVARRLARDIAYAYVTIGGTHGGYPPQPLLGFYGQGPAYLIDERVLEAHPYQILGPGHIDRLGGIPPSGRHLTADRVELTIGELHDWLPRIREAGRRTLAPCLTMRSDD